MGVLDLEPDDRMLDLLSRAQAARDDFAKVVPEYVSALKTWAALTKASAEDGIGLVDALLTRSGVGELTERQMQHILARTSHDHDTEGAWRRLEESASRYYVKKVAVTKASAAILGYINYLEALEDPGRHNVPAMLLDASQSAISHGGVERVIRRLHEEDQR